MILLVSGGWFRRRRKPQRATDDLPVVPMLDFLSFWALMGIGTFSVAISGFALYAVAELDFPADWRVWTAVTFLAVSGVVAIERAFTFWWRLR